MNENSFVLKLFCVASRQNRRIFMQIIHIVTYLTFVAVQSNRLLQETCFSSRGEIMEKSKMALVDLPNTEYKKCFQKFNKMLSIRITSKRPISIFMNNSVAVISDVSSKLLFLKLHFPCIRLNRIKFPDPGQIRTQCRCIAKSLLLEGVLNKILSYYIAILK